MASQFQQLHFVLIPLMAQGHLLPLVDMGRLLAQRGVTVTIVTTPLNAIRFHSIINRAIQSGLSIRLLELQFPSVEAGLPQGCENIDSLPSRDLSRNFFTAISMLQQPLEHFLEHVQPSPSCIISDRMLAWTANTARRFQIPRIVFDGTSCLWLLCSHNLHTSKVHESVSSESEPFVVPGLPDRIEVTKAQLPGAFTRAGLQNLKDIREEIRTTGEEAYGVVVNTFEELEPRYVEGYRKTKGNKVWSIGPVSLCNKEKSDTSERGNKGYKVSVDENQCLNWLDSRAPNSVVYACLGSISRLTPSQLMEVGLGLEASNQPFIWVVRGGQNAKELERLIIEDGFEERIKGRGFLIYGWAPQVLLLSHTSIGAFLTHCGWNSTLEGVCAGIPMVTCPLFAEQFFNEKLIVQLLKIGAGAGAKVAINWGDEEKYGLLVKSEDVEKAIDKVMDEGKEGQERRKRARELGEVARRAMEEGGSSYVNIMLLIEDIMQQTIVNRATA